MSDQTRKKVRAAADALGYTGPDPRAASLRRGRSGIVGVVVGSSLNFVFTDPVQRLMMDGLAEAVAPLGAGLLLLRSPVDVEHGPTLTTAPIDAVVLIGCDATLRESLGEVRARGIPIVAVEGDAGVDVPRILLDNTEAQRVAAQHLRDLGHTRVAIVALRIDAFGTGGWVGTRPGDLAAITIDVTRDRLEGAREVFPDAPALATRGSSIDDGFAAGRVLFADAARRPTAVIAQSDQLAAGVIRAAEEAGLRVPEDVSVTGFDGVSVDGLAPYELTTLVQAAFDKGLAAGAAVAAQLEGRPPASVLLTCTFRIGNTTGPAPVSHR